MCLRTHSAPAPGRVRCACGPMRRPHSGACDVPADPLVACARLPAMCLKTHLTPTLGRLRCACGPISRLHSGAAMCLRTHSATTPRSSPLFGACARVPAMCLRNHSTPTPGCLRCACGPIRRPRPGACDVPADPFDAHAWKLASIRRLRSGACDVPADHSTPTLGCLRCACGPISRLRSGACDVPADPFGACARAPALCLRTHTAPAHGCLRCACGPISRLRSFACDVPADRFGAHAQELASIRRLRSGACGPIRRPRPGACDVPADPFDARARLFAMFLWTYSSPRPGA
jgi:hypothetical protein